MTDLSAVSARASAPSAALANRAMGALFFIGFGTAWLCWGDVILRGGRDWTLAPVVAMGLGLAAAAMWRFLDNRGALAEEAASPPARRSTRIFHWVNAGQWVLILILANVLHNTGLDAWLAPMIMAVVGLHLLPLAAAMGYRPHYVSGIALTVLAATFPFVAEAGPRSAAGPIGAGLILWASAIFALAVGSRASDGT